MIKLETPSTLQATATATATQHRYNSLVTRAALKALTKMADLDIEPFFKQKKGFTEEDLPDAVKFEHTDRANKITGRVIPDSGDKTIEFFYEVTRQQFLELVDELSLVGEDKWKKFRKCLRGNMKTVWDEVVDADYPQVADKTDNNFSDAVDTLVMKFLNCDQPRDVMFTYMAPNGGLTKEPFCRPETFSLRWKTMLRVSKMLPQGEGDIAPPSAKLQLVWFYHGFCKKHRLRYKSSGRKWKDETHQGLVEFMSHLHQEDLDNGNLEKLAMRKAEKELRQKARASRTDGRRRAAYEAERRPYRSSYRRENDGREYRRSDSSRRYDSGRRSSQKDIYRRERDGRSKSHKSSRHSKDGSGKTCPKHGPGHSWEECRLNPKNQAKGGRHESHHQDASSVGESDRESVASSRSERSYASSRSHASGPSQDENIFAMDLIQAKKKSRKDKKEKAKKKVRATMADETERIPKKKGKSKRKRIQPQSDEEDEEKNNKDESAFANMGYDGAGDDEEGQIDD